jgi:hypothetical protein
MGIALVAPIRDISTRGRDNEFIVAVQEWVEPLRAADTPRARGTGSHWDNAQPQTQQENPAALGLLKAAWVVCLYHRGLAEIKPEFLDMMVGLVCEQDRKIQTTARLRRVHDHQTPEA